MTFEQQNHEPLINQKESSELKTGEIDRVQDEAIGSYADLKAFLDEQAVQARETLAKKANALKGNLAPEVVAQALQEANDTITESIDIAFRELSIASLRASCSQLSDIVGFELEIDEDGLDQFGLSRRATLRNTMHGTGFQNYKGERVKTGDKVAGSLEFAEQRERLRSLDTPMTEVQAVVDDMKPFGKVEYISYAERGPVLIVLPEIHHDAGVIRDNFDLLLKVKDRIALLASEGAEGEVTQDMVEGKGKSTREEYLTRIADYDVSISTIAVEDVLGEDLRTLGVEKIGTLLYTLREVQRRMGEAMVSFKENPKLGERMAELETKMIGGNLRKGDLLTYQGELANLISEGFNEMLLYYRNQIWLNAVQQELLQNQGSLSADNNLVVLVCGGAHAEDLLKQAQHYGFKGVVRFMPSAFQAPMDMRIMSAYMEKQMGVPSREEKAERVAVAHEVSAEEREQLSQYRAKLEVVLTQSAYSSDFQRYAYSYLVKQGIESARIDKWIKDSKSPNLALLEATVELTGEKQPPAEGDFKTKLESLLSVVMSALVQEARSDGNKNFEGIVSLIKDQVGLDVKV